MEDRHNLNQEHIQVNATEIINLDQYKIDEIYV